MKNSPALTRKFICSQEAWYARIPSDAHLYKQAEVMIHVEAGGVDGEFAIRWKQVGGAASPRLEMYDDAWAVLPHVSDLLQEMAKLNDQNVTPQAFCSLLKSLGMKDATERLVPKSSRIGLAALVAQADEAGLKNAPEEPAPERARRSHRPG